MALTKKKINFMESEVCERVRQHLEAMDADTAYNTTPGYSANTALYPDNKLPFIDKHLHYLSSHPNVDPLMYVSNLRLMTRLK